MNSIRQVSEQQGKDWTLFRRAVFIYCLKNGIEPPTDSGMRLWWGGQGNPNGSNLLMIAKVLGVEAGELLGAQGRQERNGE